MCVCLHYLQDVLKSCGYKHNSHFWPRCILKHMSDAGAVVSITFGLNDQEYWYHSLFLNLVLVQFLMILTSEFCFTILSFTILL